MLLTYLGHSRWHSLGHCCGLCENLSPTHNDCQLACEAEISSTSQANQWSMPGTDYVSMISVHSCSRPCQVGWQHMRIRLKLSHGIKENIMESQEI